jgi:hypothetical protein
LTTCVLEDVVVDEATWGLELPLVVPPMELEGETKRVLLCVEESWLEAVEVTAVLKESELSIEEVAKKLEETAVEVAPSIGW